MISANVRVTTQEVNDGQCLMPILPDIIEEYEQQRSDPNCIFGNGLSFLKSFLRYNLLKVVPALDEAALMRIGANCKPTSSVIEKIDRPTRQCYHIMPGEQISNLEELRGEIRDLVRGRVVVDYISEADTLSKEIVEIAEKEEWPISDRKECLYVPNDTGYRAFHVTLCIPTAYGQCYCEIQIFTVNQFSWASKTHPLQWKPVEEPPYHLKEIMRHLSDCLHTSDRLFETVREYLAEDTK